MKQNKSGRWLRNYQFIKKVSIFMAIVLIAGSIPLSADTEAVRAAAEISNTGDSVNDIARKRVTVHDPSIVKDPKTGRYYIFGSHLAWAYSDDLENWTTFTNNINTNYKTLFKNEFEWSAAGDSVYDPSGNLWAPDVVYNESMGKWCMYMSINGCSWNSSIVLLTADSLSGNWTYVGPVVYSGFTDDTLHSFTKTDYTEITGDSSLPSRYKTTAYTTKDDKTPCEPTTWNNRYGAHAIDPCVFYDENGKLWMSYGSWSGGIYLFELDEKTGLRDKSVKYEYSEGVSDPYMGKKIGGSTASGEASYIEHIGNYYYLFLSYGGFTANGGYNMRVFRSENPDGPYTDVSGDAATKGGSVNGSIGTRLMSYYKWSYWDYAQVAQGHNSAFVDDDGNAYVIYHTRTNDGTEGHTVRVHQLFTTENDYLVAAPFEYSKTDKVKTAYTAAEIAGDYEILFQNNTDNTKLEYNEPQKITLKEDGTVTGDVTGTWTEKNGSAYVSLTINNVVYEGTFVEQTMENKNVKTLCFTTVGTNDVCLWGAKYPSDAVAVSMASEKISLPARITDDIELPKEGLFGTTVTWKSSSTSILSDGTVIPPAVDRAATLTATISKGDCSYQKKVNVNIAADTSGVKGPVKIASYYTDDVLNLADGKTESIENPLKNVDISNGVSFKFKAKRTGGYNYLSNIFAFDTMNSPTDTSTAGRLYFTGGSYLGYNAAGGFYDANVDNTNWKTGTDYIGSNKEVEIEIQLTPSGFSVLADGKEAYSNTAVAAGTTAGGISLSDYSQVLSWLSETASYLNFGFGSWWKGTFDGTISDFEIWVEQGSESTLGSNCYYAEDYEGSTVVTNLWSGAATITKETDNTKYVKMVPTGSGNRGVESSFSLKNQPAGQYSFETDLLMTSSTGGSGSTVPVTQFVLTGSDRAYNTNVNNGVASGYILKLSAEGVGNQTFTINDSSDTVQIPASTWVHVTVAMDTDSPAKAILTITDNAADKVILKEKEITVNGSGEVAGIYLLLGRGTASQACLDNTILKKPGIADYESFNKVLTKAKKYLKLNNETEVYTSECIRAIQAAVDTADALDKYLDESDQSEIDEVTAQLTKALEGLVCINHEYNDGTVKKKATCTAKGEKEVVCYQCGAVENEEIAMTAHVAGDWNVTKAATATAEGTRVRKCRNCDTVMEKESIPKLTTGNTGTTTDGSGDTTGGAGSTTGGSGTTTGGSGTDNGVQKGNTYTVKNIKYKITSITASKKTVTVSGVKKKTLKSVTIGKTVKIQGTTFKVTQIGDNAFAKCKKLKKITIGANVTKIGKKAFNKCGKLKSIVVKSKKLTKVGSSAFKGIHKKATIKVPSSKLKKYKKLFKKKGQASTVKIKK